MNKRSGGSEEREASTKARRIQSTWNSFLGAGAIVSGLGGNGGEGVRAEIR